MTLLYVAESNCLNTI